MDNPRQVHWQGVYTTKPADRVSWFQASPDASLRMMARLGLAPPTAVVDVGGGASSLVDVLSDRGFEVTVVDIADAALAAARRRLGARAGAVDWQVADVTTWQPARRYDLWHDRAVFHFLTDASDRARYCATLRAALVPGGSVIVATFAEDGPERCSGLPVSRYGADALAAAFGDGFTLVHHERELHMTPWNAEQAFTWVALRHRA